MKDKFSGAGRIVPTLFKLLLIMLSLLCVGDMSYQYINLKKCNQIPLSLQTFDDSDSPYHPSVLYSSKGWNGYHYIMAETPFYISLPSVGENYRDRYEDPSIHYSNDGIHWTKCKEPIDFLSISQIDDRDYYSDPDLVVSPNGIECWYRLNRRYGKETNQNNIVLYRKITNDGLNWSERMQVADLENGDFDDALGHTVISQTLLYESDKYKMWFVSGGGTRNGVLEYSESDSTLTSWTKKKLVCLNGPKVSPWHQHIMKDGDIYWLTIYDHHKNITIWKGTDETSFDYVCTPIESTSIIGSYYSNDLYRACLLKIPNGGRYRLYFSADDMFRTYIGIMEGNTPELLEVVSAGDGVHTDFLEFVGLYFKTRGSVLWKKVTYYSRRVIEKPIEIIRGNNG